MTYFFALPSNVKDKLLNYFEDKPAGTKIKYGFMLQEKDIAEKRVLLVPLSMYKLYLQMLFM
jgi:hypothetical protein